MALRKPTPLDLFLLMFVTLIWAGAFLAIKVAVPETGALWLAASRALIGCMALLPWALIRGAVFPSTGKQWILVVLIALLNVVIPFFLISWGQLTTDAGVTALLMGTGPILGLLASHFTTSDDRITPLKALGVVLGFSGVALVVGKGAIDGLGGDLVAQAAILLASACYVTAGSMVRHVSDLPPTRLSALVLSIATPILIVSAFVIDGPPNLSLSQEAWQAILFLGLFPTGMAYILRFHLIRTIGYSLFSLGVNLIPVFGVLLAWLILDEPLTLTLMIALGLILSGLFVARKGQG
ncbi:DMT family transporter [Coralliovum pocilloporae]|uniref:DMT family transporter n=1 Tax=Coralliovum pocilloporae TaxID=3066369 RepID=UPI003306B0DB